MVSYLERYQSGEYKAVWKELIELKDGILDPEIYDDAVEVARTTMKRVRYNVEMIYDKLIELKYEFSMPGYTFVRAISEERKQEFDKLNTGHIPISLSVRMWYEEIGEVCFTGDHPYLSTYYDPRNYRRSGMAISSDPFCCFFLLEDFFRILGQDKVTHVIDFSPDEAHKANYSGATYGMNIVQNAMDGIILFDETIYFIDYLRHVFFWGGLPGFQNYIDGTYKQLKLLKFPLIELSYLTEGLLDF